MRLGLKRFAKHYRHIAIHGKVSRHTFDGEGNPHYMVSAFASEARLVLGQEKVSDKSNEITAIATLLKVLDWKGAVITIDAIGCQRVIAAQICEKGGDYLLGLKGNQGTLHEDVKRIFEDQALLQELKSACFQDVDKGHGRIETRLYRVLYLPKVLQEHHEWPGLKTVIEVQSTQEIKGKETHENRYYITSLTPDPQKIGHIVRSHWAIENSLHWILDISFGDDNSRIQGNAPQNMGIIKHIALNPLQKAKDKRDSIKQMRKAADWDDKFLKKNLI